MYAYRHITHLSLNPTRFDLQLSSKFNNRLGNNPVPNRVLDRKGPNRSANFNSSRRSQMSRNYFSVVMLVSGALALGVVVIAQQSPTEAPTGFDTPTRSEEHTSELTSHSFISY